MARRSPPPDGSEAAEQEKLVARALERVVVVLDHPKDIVNIAGVVRVMMNFGLSSLRLVRPDEFDPWRIGGIAHRNQEITSAATIHEALDRCHTVTIIPTDPDYPSLNLAQACLLTAYEAAEPSRFPRDGATEEAFAAIEAGLSHLDLFTSRKPETVMRTLRTILSRAGPYLRETRLLAAIGHEIRHKVGRVEQEGESPRGD